MLEYIRLQRLELNGFLGTKTIKRAFFWFVQHDWIEGEPSQSIDKELLFRCKQNGDPLPLLCLRCKVSHPLGAWLRVTHAKNQETYGLELAAMASYALDDDGKQTIRTGPKTETAFLYAQIASMPACLISPFSAEVLRTYNPELLPYFLGPFLF